jgi:polysaccharide deacetylase 2 family uncharacterized protein YibQ
LAVAPDDLNAPLGQKKPKKKRLQLPIATPQLVAGVLGLCGLVVIGWAMFADDPLGGRPWTVVDATSATKGPGQQGRDPSHPQAMAKTAGEQGPAAEAAMPPPGGRTITIIDGSSGKHKSVVVPGNRGAPVPKAGVDNELLQETHEGMIPKIGPDGMRAFARYATPREVPENRKDAPRIAIIVGGLGISAAATAEALTKLPPPVTLAFAPYGNNLEPLAAEARKTGHEVLLQVPMEPLDYPNNDPGPRTLLTSLSNDQNMERLHWLMARIKGYVGLSSYMGARFTASTQALAPVLREAAKRGLIFVDDGSSPRSIAGQLAGTVNLPFAKADSVLDAVPTPLEIERALARLEMTARANEVAVGYASAQQSTITVISRWAKEVESRGFLLVPITMVAVKSKSS